MSIVVASAPCIQSSNAYTSGLPDPDPRARPLEGLVKYSVLSFMEDPREASEILISKAHDEGAERIAGTIDGGVRCGGGSVWRGGDFTCISSSEMGKLTRY